MFYEESDIQRLAGDGIKNDAGFKRRYLRRLLDHANHVCSTYRLFDQSVDVVAVAIRIARQQEFPQVTAEEICAALVELSEA